MFNSAQFEKLDFEVFSKKKLKENSLRSIYGGAENHTYEIIGIDTPTDTVDEEGCTMPLNNSHAVAKCDTAKACEEPVGTE